MALWPVGLPPARLRLSLCGWRKSPGLEQQLLTRVLEANRGPVGGDREPGRGKYRGPCPADPTWSPRYCLLDTSVHPGAGVPSAHRVPTQLETVGVNKENRGLQTGRRWSLTSSCGPAQCPAGLTPGRGVREWGQAT